MFDAGGHGHSIHQADHSRDVLLGCPSYEPDGDFGGYLAHPADQVQGLRQGGGSDEHPIRATLVHRRAGPQLDGSIDQRDSVWLQQVGIDGHR